MPQRASWLIAALLSACSAETPPVRLMVAEEMPAFGGAAPAERMVEEDLAGDARALFFAQADLYLAGADPALDGKLSDVLRAMGRDDLAGSGEPANGCPRQWVDPVELLSQSVGQSQVVILESDPHAPAQTAFLEGILTRLKKDGFTYFADDGLSLGPGGEGHPDVLLVSEGLVTRDPDHGRLLRAAKRLDLQLVDAGVWWSSPRELAEMSPEMQLAKRQSALSLQISRRAFEQDAGARILIHMERSAYPEAAEAFKTSVSLLTGHHPLLVSLADCASPGAVPAYLPGYADGPGAGEAADLVFAVPRSGLSSGRLSAGALRGETAVTLPPGFETGTKPLLVEARRAGDPDLAVPEDRLMLFPGERLPLMLPPGDYRIEAWTRDGRVAPAVTVNVT